MVMIGRLGALPIPDGLISVDLRERIELAPRNELISRTYPYELKMRRGEYEAEKRLLNRRALIQ